ncbi:TetR/AcrR family transcriptional regulator [Granulicella sibirica]|uniref:Transcriptional regulator, TetR family n=1 Tax=Granulicella sibirica TaxID=2479048 RepID=A0A4Q0T609_9BACT|nr:TetR/AcrR family transcriptional regulator [Granulicella sibirica]RXH57056.1 Transcriptional regulator, TetR family [Granulicella sibirica]
MAQSPERSIFDSLAALDVMSKRDTILAAATRVFIQHGYEGTSMELVAKTACAARRTLYNQFPEGKAQLFSAVVERMWKAFPVMSIATDEAMLADPEKGLRTIGYAIGNFWKTPLSVSFLRMIIGEASRFPELMRSFFDAGKTPAVGAIRNYIAELGKRGTLDIDDAGLASEQFIGMIDESVLWVRVMGSDSELASERIAAVVEQAVAIFLGHYRKPAQRVARRTK